MAYSAQRNSLKHRALRIFASYGPLNPPAWSLLAQFFPARASYSYLLRLHRFGLLQRTRDNSGLILYSLSNRGQDRLKWLTVLTDPKASQTRAEDTAYSRRGPK